ncbi:2-hydroxyacid dehydrogenase [Pontibaca salina]|uniref:Glyoxylate/hydroxypyruvate reductase A n=1 Tax=Pontibaca salina TaxID=2795731 RepID=A0A934HQ96_9RHOB|nr:glyoxylate/hydroxypyruvate reductase A [Pontibaca salina]MBI6628625.1 glyoxylate/hydroxypyruvate reductase A [Pontibaca salina]
MPVNILFASSADWADYQLPLHTELAQTGLEFDLRTDFPPEMVDYIVYAPNSPVQDFTPYSRLKAVLNIWAGVEDVVTNSTLTVPLTRMVDPGLERGMVEWVTGHTLRHHLGMDAHIINPEHEWTPVAPPLAQDRPVTILGLGALGTACARALSSLGFPVTGWSRSAKSLEGINCTHGEAGLAKALATAQIVILLLPATAATENTLNAQTLALLPRGAVVLNPGRGTLIDDTALLDALDSGQIGHATLDTFRTEPLPRDHRYWSHPHVTVTPHIASETRPASSSHVIAENIRRNEAGLPLLHIVDRSAGY